MYIYQIRFKYKGVSTLKYMRQFKRMIFLKLKGNLSNLFKKKPRKAIIRGLDGKRFECAILYYNWITLSEILDFIL